MDYYGVITEIISLQYLNGKRVVLFNCDWWDVNNKGKGVKVDKHGFVTVNSRRKLKTNEPFVLASEARQVFYAKDGFHPDWLIVLKTQPRHHYDVPSTIRSSKGNSGMGMEAQQQDSSGSSHIAALLISEEEDKDFDALAEKRDDIDEVIIHASEDNAPKFTNHEEELQMEGDVSEDENCLFDDDDNSISDTE